MGRPAVLEEMRTCRAQYKGRFGIGTCTGRQPLFVFVNEQSNIRRIEYTLAADRKYFGDALTAYPTSEYTRHAQMPQILEAFGFPGAILRAYFMTIKVERSIE
jgi:hypothetical protein